jgi:uncharacterized protein YkwD
MKTKLRLPTVLLVLAGASFGLVRAAEEKPELKLSPDEQKILELTNQTREKEKLAPLKPNAVLFEVARAHSANMAKQGKMEHDLDDKTPAQRVKAAGYEYSWTGENIAMGENWPITGVFQGWMDSPPHRENILNGNFQEIGIGIAKDKAGKVYYTQVFGTKRRR